MILEFADGTQLQVRDIFGGPRLAMGVMRDTLKIEVDPSTIKFDELRALFKDNPNTTKLYTYTTPKGSDKEVKTEIGEGYRIFLSIGEETRTVNGPPGKMAPTKYEEVYVVQIAQQTYEEYIQSNPSEKEE